jgi:hypothetical protein
LSVEAGHDLALSLDTADTAGRETVRPRLVVNLRPGDMARPFAGAVSAYARASALEVWGLAFSQEDEVLMRRFAQEGCLSLAGLERPATLSEALDALRGARVAAGMRLHFAILAATVGIPLVAAPYDPKVEAFAKERQIPLWREGLLPFPEPRLSPPPLSSPFSTDSLREEIDALCRRVLGNSGLM